MHVLVTCKNEDDPIKDEDARVFTKKKKKKVCRCSRADNSGVGGGIRPNFELIQVFMHVLITCKNEDYSIKNEGARLVTTFFPL